MPGMKIVTLPLSISSVYLLPPCTGGYLQVDTGYPKDYRRYRRQLARAGIGVSQVKYLFLTHHHDDHAGFLNDLTRDANVVIIARALLKTGRNDTTHGGGYINPMVKALAGLQMRLDPSWTLTFPPYDLRSRDIVVNGEDDAVLRRLGAAGRILYTPGHCLDHLALALDTGQVFCGDMASSFLLWAGVKYCTLFMTDMEEAYCSWQKVLAVGATTLCPAHGRPFPAAKLRENLGRVKTRDLVSLS